MHACFIKYQLTAKLMSAQWTGDKHVKTWTLPRCAENSTDNDDGAVEVMACGHFQKKFDRIQGMIQQIGCMDELLSGECMCKSWGKSFE